VTKFTFSVRVYYEDTDSGGVVYYANYLKFMERARTEWLRSFSIQQDALRERYGVIFAVRQVQIDYCLPAKFNDELVVTADVSNQGKASLTFQQEILRKNDVLAKATIKIASLDEKLFKPVAIPAIILEKIK